MVLNDLVKQLFAKCSAKSLPATLVLLIALFISGCDSSETNDSASNSGSTNGAAPVQSSLDFGPINASPNPVPAGNGNGIAKITWNIEENSAKSAEVYVSENGKPEVKFAEGLKGSQEAPWIGVNTNYEFRLYTGTGTDRKLAGKVLVTRNK